MVIPISQHQDTVGPLARTVKDAAYILQAIAGQDIHDNYTSAIPNNPLPDYIAACNISALSGSRLGVPRNVLTLLSRSYGNWTDPFVAAFESSLEILKSAGATILDDVTFTAADEFWTTELRSKVLSADFIIDIQNYLEALEVNPNNITSLEDLREFTRAYPSEEYPERDTARWDAVLEQGWNNTSPEFWPAYQQLLNYSSEGGLLGALERHGLDAIILPTYFASDWASALGSPVITVPLGFYPPDVPIRNELWDLVDPAPNLP
jgi:amidase